MLLSDSLTMLVKQKHVPKYAIQFTLPLDTSPTPSHESIFHVSHWLEPVNSYEPSPSLFFHHMLHLISQSASEYEDDILLMLKRQH